MFFSSSGGYSFTTTLADEAATYRLMTDVAAILEPGDLITLSGDLGAGKTTFARALIRYLANDNTIEVPSPTFTLTQTYALPGFPVVHADLYRDLGDAGLAVAGENLQHCHGSIDGSRAGSRPVELSPTRWGVPRDRDDCFF